MNRLVSSIRNNHERIQRVLLFMIAAFLLILMLPKEGKFKYEYQKGQPWSHEDLMAPFDFAIEKSDDELNRETEEIRSNASVYLKPVPDAEKNARAAFRKELLAELQPDSSKNRSLKKFDRHLTVGNSLLDKLYERGLLRISAELEAVQASQPVLILRGNRATAVSLDRFYTVNSAYDLFREALEEEKRIDQEILLRVLSASIVQNVVYDPEATERALQSELEAVSTTRGMVPKGLMVIAQGDMVDAEKFRVLESLRKEYQTRLGSSESYYLILLGQLLMVGVVLLMFYMFLVQYRSRLAQDNWQVTFLLMLIVLMVLLASSVMRMPSIDLYVVPFCLLPVIVRSFYDSRVALFAHLVALIIIGFEAPNGYEFMFLQLIGGIVAIFSLLSLQNRSQLFVSMLIVFIAYSVSYFSLAVMQEGTVRTIDLSIFLWFAASVGLTLLAYPLIYLFEKTFGFISDVTLLELNNTNHPLLRQMASEAPGTFQHSLQVASLAESAVYEVGGNALLIRTAALYHDIGKLHAPMYYVENQVTGVNPHDDLSFDESAKIIIDHVINGIGMAKKHGLPEQLIDFIRTHHGTSTVQYFYRSYLQNFPEGELDREHFSYPGPKPFTKEMAILMMADSVEAASRSLKEYTTETVGKLVDNIIDHQFNEEQFNSAEITLRDIAEVRSIFKKKLMNIYHVRMEYPD